MVEAHKDVLHSRNPPAGAACGEVDVQPLCATVLKIVLTI